MHTLITRCVYVFFGPGEWGGGGVHLEILGGGVPPGSSNPDRQKLYYHYVDYSANKKNIQIHFEFAYFSFFPYSFGIETINTFIHSIVSSKTIPDSRPNGQSVYPIPDQNGAKTLPDGAAHTYMAYITEYPPGLWFCFLFLCCVMLLM